MTSNTDNSSWSLLHCAIACEDEPVLRLLFSLKARANVATTSNWTLLHEACRTGNASITRLVLEQIQAQKLHAAIDATTDTGITPLLVASFCSFSGYVGSMHDYESTFYLHVAL